MSQDPAREAVEHVQEAVLQLIRAGRSLLEAAEVVVQDPASVVALLNAMGARGPVPGRDGGDGGDPAAGAPGGADETVAAEDADGSAGAGTASHGVPRRPRVTRIPVR
jgi:hypothetical protein